MLCNCRDAACAETRTDPALLVGNHESNTARLMKKYGNAQN
ncbi:hypothetical protein SAMN05216599_113169 [Pseudomonas cichorii]|nr:hypothetical protein SAMN05216599_113169 [Pseudomonas cichorii]